MDPNPYARLVEYADRGGIISGKSLINITAWSDIINAVLAGLAPGATVSSTSRVSDGSVNFQVIGVEHAMLGNVLNRVPGSLPGNCVIKVGDAATDTGRARAARAPSSSGPALYIKVTQVDQAQFEQRQRWAGSLWNCDFCVFVLSVVCMVLVSWMWFQHNEPYMQPFEILADFASRSLDQRIRGTQALELKGS